jgi:predicted ABC-type sugar transport system permease subunit
MYLSGWMKLGDIGQVDTILAMLSQPEWAALTLASALCACVYMKSDPGYGWAFFIGFWSAFAGLFLLLLQVVPSRFLDASLYYPPGMVGWGALSVAAGAAILILQGWLIIEKQVMVFALLSLLSLNPLVWLINASYTLYLMNRRGADE